MRFVWGGAPHNEFNLRCQKLQKAQAKAAGRAEQDDGAQYKNCCWCWTNYFPILSDNLFQHLLLKFVSRERTIYARQPGNTHTQLHSHILSYVDM